MRLSDPAAMRDVQKNNKTLSHKFYHLPLPQVTQTITRQDKSYEHRSILILNRAKFSLHGESRTFSFTAH